MLKRKPQQKKSACQLHNNIILQQGIKRTYSISRGIPNEFTKIIGGHT